VVQSFQPLHYDYLPKIRLNVGSVEVEDHSAPIGPNDVAGSSPVIPAQALDQMAHDRLVAAGVAGTVHFVIDQASILREPSGALDGQFGVHLDIGGAGGGRTGYAEAHVARTHVPGPDPEDDRANLYNLTRQMMDDMNVELAFQIHKSLGPWLVTGDGVPAPVMAQPLPPPAPPEVPQAPPPPSPAPPPPSDGYMDPALPASPAQPTPPQLSPPPTYLTPPPGAGRGS
jgi:hypothetical protein